MNRNFIFFINVNHGELVLSVRLCDSVKLSENQDELMKELSGRDFN